MTDAAVAAPQPPLWRRLIGFNLITGLVLGVVGWYVGWFGAHAIRRHEHRLLRRHRLQRAVRLPRLHRRDRRLPRRPRLPQLPGQAPARLPAVAAGEGGGRLDALLQPLHRPQGRRHPVPLGHRAVLLHRRPERDADPHGAADSAQPGLPRRHLPDDRRHARHDDDGDDDERDPRPVRELLHPDHDRRPADGLPTDRGAHVLAPDGGRRGPDDDDLLRRLPDRLDGLRAALHPGQPGLRQLRPLLRPRRRLDDAARPEHDRHDPDDARARPDVDAAADLRLGRPLDLRADGAGGAGADLDTRDGGARPDGADDVLQPGRRREQLPVPEPVLGVRAPGGVHPRPAGVRDRPRVAAGVRAQAALGLSARRRRACSASRSSPGSSGSTTCS